MSDFIPKINSAIKYSFYLIFFLVPIAMWPDTYELFEFNKMWVVFIMSVIIFFLWASKMIIEGRIKIRRTPLDIPIALILISHIVSTIFSMEPHTSLWGYYSRFNGGLLSIISYFFLYYAFVTNLIPDETTDKEKPISYKVLFVSLLSGIFVALWGLPSHYGYDLTCFFFRGELNVSCWTSQFHPTVRIFSTLGQPNWMGTFLAVLIPIAIGFGLSKVDGGLKKFKLPAFFLLSAVGFYISVLWTRSQSSFLGLVMGMILFAVLITLTSGKIKEIPGKIVKDNLVKITTLVILVFAVATFFIGSPVIAINKYFSLNSFSEMISQPSTNTEEVGETSTEEAGTEEQSFTSNTTIRVGGSESGDIRLIVWEGALELFRRNPIFGTGVETFAYAYYLVKPVEHNLTSEWDYLYNKAHNEYLNYLSTTGAFGFLSYMSFIALFYFYALKAIFKNKSSKTKSISIGILSGITALLISNFFGFSVVILNLFLFLMPLFLIELEAPDKLKKSFSYPARTDDMSQDKIGTGRMTILAVVGIISLLMLLHLVNFWFADRAYALGYNLNKAGEYVRANPYLTDAVNKLPSEDLYKDELSVNLATLAILAAQQNQAQQAQQFGTQAVALSDELAQKHPDNVVYLKTRARVGFALAQLEPSFIDMAIQTVIQAKEVAPTDAKLAYNLALFYNQKSDTENAIKNMEEAIALKPDYFEPHYAIVLIYTQLAEDNPENAEEYKAKAREYGNYALENIDPDNQAMIDALENL